MLQVVDGSLGVAQHRASGLGATARLDRRHLGQPGPLDEDGQQRGVDEQRQHHHSGSPVRNLRRKMKRTPCSRSHWRVEQSGWSQLVRLQKRVEVHSRNTERIRLCGTPFRRLAERARLAAHAPRREHSMSFTSQIFPPEGNLAIAFSALELSSLTSEMREREGGK